MKTLFILIIFVSLVFAIKLINKNETKKDKSKESVELIFSKIYKHRFDTL